MRKWLSVLPDLISLLAEFLRWVKSVERDESKSRLAQIAEAMKAVRTANDEDSRRHAAQSLSRVINGMQGKD